MTMRITGMNSGLDTESIITELIKAKSTKKDNLVKAQKKLEYKQDAWKTLNSKIYTLYNKTINNLKYTTAYKQQKATVSDSSVASVIVGSNASNGVQNLTVKSLAKSGYLTGAQLSEDGAYSSSTKLCEIGTKGADGTITYNVSESDVVAFSVTTGGTDIKLTGASTIGDVVSQLKDAGVNANFDEKNQRLFISAKSTGTAADFKIEATSDISAGTNGYNALTALGINEETCLNTGTNGATRITGENAKITLNDAVFESATNVFEINGLTITATKENAGEVVTITTADDYDAIYDTIKNFFKEYNTLINEMDALYNAEDASDYEPLTDEEKEEMSESEIEKWEQKIKDSILRRDSTISEVSSLMKTAMMKGYEVNGKTMYLSSFGINTLGYFNSADNERNAYHIDGDPDDENTMGNTDILKSMIANEPETVISFFTQLTNELYSQLGEKMKSDDYSSFNKVYNDKQMTSDYESYKTKIAEQEEKITEAEDKYYKQFSAMETALAKIQSKESALSGLLGG